MKDSPEKPIEQILHDLRERAKELDCLYRVEEILRNPSRAPEEVFPGLLTVLPPGFQYPKLTQSRIRVPDHTFVSEGLQETPWKIEAPIEIQGEAAGSVEIFYTEALPEEAEGPFLKEERRLINSIADRIGTYLERRQFLDASRPGGKETPIETGRPEWWVVVDFLKRTDQGLLLRVSRKTLNHLCWRGIDDALDLLHGLTQDGFSSPVETDENQPVTRRSLLDGASLADSIFQVAEAHLDEAEILACIQRYIKEDNSRNIVQTLSNPDTSMEEATDAIIRYHHRAAGTFELSKAAEIGLRVSLIERFFTGELKFLNTAKKYLEVDDFHELVERIIHPPKSHGKLGGKSAGLFLASHVLRRNTEHAEVLGGIKVPKTWYITSDGLLTFIQYNNLEDAYSQKYVEIDQVRQEYPYLVQVFKNSQFTAEIIRGLSLVLDDLEGRPLIVRSSSLLEDRFGSAFSGKYKSLFLANRGTKQQRLAKLMDAIAEVYASTFGPDPIEYRAERALIDVYEEMGIMIQQVVGVQVGRYYLPCFAGVAFSRNEFRWSSRIKREDGLIRLVPGLGTRAVDRLKDDYPVLLAPGQPGLRVNVSPDEILRYSPKFIDAIDLETESFTTVEIDRFLRECGAEYPIPQHVFSVYDRDQVRRPVGLSLDFEGNDHVVTFEGLIASTPFILQVQTMLQVLEEALGTPVDVEFASDGRDFYLLQCRPQGYSEDAAPAPIPKEIPEDRILFSANRFISNGVVPDITQIVYVDSDAYNELETVDEMKSVGRAIGRLNKLLPKRKFVLIGPGRWGSRGDIKLGVNVTYSDINNSAVLIEVARKRGNYVPDLSFGTHFFQDLVEASIRYLPLYPDDKGTVFNERFLNGSENLLQEILPEFASLSRVVRVIDVPKSARGRVLRILMNAGLDEAVGYLADPGAPAGTTAARGGTEESDAGLHWRWRLRFAERIAAEIDPERFGVEAAYLIGSTKNATAGPGSDIDLLVHFRGSPEQRRDLERWLEGWSLCLGEMNFLRTGYRVAKLLDVQILTDNDFQKRTSFAVKIGAITDPARLLPLGTPRSRGEGRG